MNKLDFIVQEQQELIMKNKFGGCYKECQILTILESYLARHLWGTGMIFLITTCVNAKSMNSFRECVVIMGAGLGVTNIMDIF